MTQGRRLFVNLLLILLVLGIYGQTAGFDFINLDDDVYVVLNPRVNTGLSPGTIAWAFTGTAGGNWHPVTWLSHMLDVQLFGLAPRGHHLVNVLLHATNALLLLLLLQRLTGSLWRSALVAALFTAHPLHVESVAWVAERKDVLSTLLGLLAILAYLGYARKPEKARYLLALGLFTLGLMAKPMLVTLPAVLLLLDFWPLGRYGGIGAAPRNAGGRGRVPLGRLLGEKIPFVVLALGSGIITLGVQSRGGAVKSTDLFSLQDRLANALVAYVSYIGDMLWPTGLAVYYPHPAGSLPAWAGMAAAGVLGLVCAAVLQQAGRRPHLAVGWFWYLATLVPVIGFIQVGTQARADRYTYLPLTGLFIALAWSLPRPRRGAARAYAFAVLAAMAVGLLALGARVQTGYWKDSVTLLSHALDVVSGGRPTQAPPRSMLLYFNLGNAYSDRAQHAQAIESYKLAIADYPWHAKIYFNLGNSYAALGQHREAVTAYQKAVELAPDFADAYFNLGDSYLMLGLGQESARAIAQATALEKKAGQ